MRTLRRSSGSGSGGGGGRGYSVGSFGSWGDISFGHVEVMVIFCMNKPVVKSLRQN